MPVWKALISIPVVFVQTGDRTFRPNDRIPNQFQDSNLIRSCETTVKSSDNRSFYCFKSRPEEEELSPTANAEKTERKKKRERRENRSKNEKLRPIEIAAKQ